MAAACPPPPPPPPHRHVTQISSQVFIEQDQEEPQPGHSKVRSLSLGSRSGRTPYQHVSRVLPGRFPGPPRAVHFGDTSASSAGTYHTAHNWTNASNQDPFTTCADFSIPSSQETPEGWHQSLNSTPNLEFSDEFNPQYTDFSVPSSQETPEGWYQSLNSTPLLESSGFSCPSDQGGPPADWGYADDSGEFPSFSSPPKQTAVADLESYEDFNPECADFSGPSTHQVPEGWYQSLNSTPDLEFGDYSCPSDQGAPPVDWGYHEDPGEIPQCPSPPRAQTLADLNSYHDNHPEYVDFSVPSSQETPEGWYQSLNSTPNLDFSDTFNPDWVDFSVPSAQETPEEWYLNQSLNSTPDLEFGDFTCPPDQGMPPPNWGYQDDSGEIPPCPPSSRTPRQQRGGVTCRPHGRSAPPPPTPPPPAAAWSRPPTPMPSPNTVQMSQQRCHCPSPSTPSTPSTVVSQPRMGCEPIEGPSQRGTPARGTCRPFGRSPPPPPSPPPPATAWSRPPTPLPSPNTVQTAQQRHSYSSPSTPSTPSTVVSQPRSGCEPIEGPSQTGTPARGKCCAFGRSPPHPPSPPPPAAACSRPPSSNTTSQRSKCGMMEDAQEMQRWCSDIEKRFQALKQKLNEQCPPLSSDLRQRLLKSQDKVSKGINRLKCFIEERSRKCQ